MDDKDSKEDGDEGSAKRLKDSSNSNNDNTKDVESGNLNGTTTYNGADTKEGNDRETMSVLLRLGVLRDSDRAIIDDAPGKAKARAVAGGGGGGKNKQTTRDSDTEKAAEKTKRRILFFVEDDSGDGGCGGGNSVCKGNSDAKSIEAAADDEATRLSNRLAMPVLERDGELEFLAAAATTTPGAISVIPTTRTDSNEFSQNDLEEQPMDLEQQRGNHNSSTAPQTNGEEEQADASEKLVEAELVEDQQQNYHDLLVAAIPMERNNNNKRWIWGGGLLVVFIVSLTALILTMRAPTTTNDDDTSSNNSSSGGGPAGGGGENLSFVANITELVSEEDLLQSSSNVTTATTTTTTMPPLAQTLQYGNVIVGGFSPLDHFGYPSAMSSDGTILALASHNSVRVYQAVGVVVPGGQETPAMNQSNSTTSQEEEEEEEEVVIRWVQLGNPVLGLDPNGEDRFADTAIDLSSNGRRLIVGAPEHNVNNNNTTILLQKAGVAQVFDLTDDNTTWVQVGPTIEGQEEEKQFGFGVSLSDDGRILAVGGQGGFTKVFQEVRTTSSSSSPTTKTDTVGWQLIGSPIPPRAEIDTFGKEVVLSPSGRRLVIGSERTAPGNNNGPGYVRVYDLVNKDWQQIGQDLEGDDDNDNFGRQVAISTDGSVIVVAARNAEMEGARNKRNTGMVRAYRYDDESTNLWVQMGHTLWGNSHEDTFGESVDLSTTTTGYRIVVGASQRKVEGYGYARIFDFDDATFNNDGGQWQQIGTDLDGRDIVGGEAGNMFGRSAKLSSNGNIVAVCAYRGDLNGTDSGHVVVFDLSQIHDANGI